MCVLNSGDARNVLDKYMLVVILEYILWGVRRDVVYEDMYDNKYTPYVTCLGAYDQNVLSNQCSCN